MSRLGNLFGADSVATFLGAPVGDLEALRPGDIALIGAPVATPYRSLGTYAAGSPAALRAGAADFAGALLHHDFDLGGPLLGAGDHRLVDCGDLLGDPDDAPGNRARIATAVGTVIRSGAVPVVLGGDDSVPIPVFQAFEGRGRFTVVQVDAHIDWRDEVGGEHFGLSSTMRRASEMPWIERIVQVGARGVGSARPADFEAAREWGVDFHLARDVHRDGIEAVIEAIPAGADVLLTIDCDGLDPSVIPAVIGPAPGGLSYTQTVELMAGIAGRARIRSFDIVEFMPSRDPTGLGALAAARLVCNAIGLIARTAF